MVTDEADAVLDILAKKENGRQITDADWRKLFESEGYVRSAKARAFDEAFV